MPLLVRTSAAMAMLTSVLSILAAVHGRIMGLSADTYLITAALWTALAVAIVTRS